MGQHYNHIDAAERNFIQRQLNLGRSQTWIAGALGRSVSAISREVGRGGSAYDAVIAGAGALARRLSHGAYAAETHQSPGSCI